LGRFGPLLKQTSFFVAAGAVSKIGSSLKPNQHYQVQLVQIRETLFTNLFSSYNFYLFSILSLEWHRKANFVHMFKTVKLNRKRIKFGGIDS